MDFSFYALLTMACLVLVLAMWACASSSTSKWGPDLTLELPPHLLKEALFGSKTSESKSIIDFERSPIPSAPSERLYDPLLSNEQAMATSDPPPTKTKLSQLHHNKLDIPSAVKVLPNYAPAFKTPRPVFSTFKMEETV